MKRAKKTASEERREMQQMLRDVIAQHDEREAQPYERKLLRVSFTLYGIGFSRDFVLYDSRYTLPDGSYNAAPVTEQQLLAWVARMRRQKHSIRLRTIIETAGRREG
jgi:hypothetical protein